VSLLKQYYARLGYNPGLVPVLLEEGEHDETDITSRDLYEIEKIVAYQYDREGTLFRARWLSWLQEYDEWFRESDLEGA
jgi:hypothetical protein